MGEGKLVVCKDLRMLIEPCRSIGGQSQGM